MEFDTLIQSVQAALGDTLPGVGAALLILVLGWFVALVVRATLRRFLHMTRLNERFEAGTDSQIDLERGVSLGAYYVLLAMVLIAFFNALDLTEISSTLQSFVDQILAFLPKLIAGGVLLGVAVVIGNVVRMGARRLLAQTQLDERLSRDAGLQPVSESLGDVLYWLTLLLFLPAVLGALEMKGLLAPVQGMVQEILGHLPNVFAAAIIALVGYFVARILRELVRNLTAAAGADDVGRRAGLSEDVRISHLLGLVVYIFVFVPSLIAALNTLSISAISDPAIEMLAVFMGAIPGLFAAAVILAVAWVVSNFVAGLLGSLLGGMGADELPARLGVASALPAGLGLSELAGRLVVFFVMLGAVVEAASRLGFGQVSELVTALLAFGADVLLGVVIIAVGVWISNLAHQAVQRTDAGGSAAIASVARFGILGLVLAMGLRAMGLADSIVNMAFGLVLGALAVAFALSFGLGGREAAGRQMDHWLTRLRGEG